MDGPSPNQPLIAAPASACGPCERGWPPSRLWRFGEPGRSSKSEGRGPASGSAKRTNRTTAVPAPDPGGGGRCRPAALAAIVPPLHPTRLALTREPVRQRSRRLRGSPADAIRRLARASRSVKRRRPQRGRFCVGCASADGKNTDVRRHHLVIHSAIPGAAALTGNIDIDRIVWIGHSRGAEGVAIAYDRMFDGTYTPINYNMADIKLISSMLPTDWTGVSRSEEHTSELQSQ